MLAMFAWSPTVDIGKLPSVLEITKRVDQSCEAAVAATPPDKGNTAFVSDCSGSSDTPQCLKGASSSRASGFCAAGNNDDCCKDYTCVPTISSNSEILFGYLSSTVSLVGQCLMTQSSPIVKPRRTGRRTVSHHEKQMQKRASPRKRANDPFCNEEFGSPNYDHCDAAWHQVPIDNIQRWFYNGNYDALPTGTPKPIEQLPQSWQSG